MKKAGFCGNSNRWIEFMVCKPSPPNSCPNQNLQFGDCESCSYYEEREPTAYLLRRRMLLKKVLAMMVEL